MFDFSVEQLSGRIDGDRVVVIHVSKVGIFRLPGTTRVALTAYEPRAGRQGSLARNGRERIDQPLGLQIYECIDFLGIELAVQDQIGHIPPPLDGL